jgi:cytochrome bd-type quinol oxidase subunit 2
MFDLRRLRGGEWIIGGASLAQLIAFFFLPWYGLQSTYAPAVQDLGYRTDYDGWTGLTTLRYLILLVILVGFIAWWLQATRRGPALPICATVIEMLLSAILFVALLYRVLDPPASTTELTIKAGLYAGLVLTGAIFAGCYISCREDGLAERDAPQQIELLRLAPRRRPGPRIGRDASARTG